MVSRQSQPWRAHLLRLPVALGIYSGISIHCDTRPIGRWAVPDRWLAVKQEEEHELGDLKRLIYRRADGWAYCIWSDSHGDSFRALRKVVELAERRQNQ